MPDQEKLLDFIACTGALIEKDAADERVKQAQDQRIEELIPQAVKALLENERIEPHQQKQAAEVLHDPVRVLEILIKTASPLDKEARLGTPVAPQGGQQKKASAGGNNYGRRPVEDSEASRALKAKLGLPTD